jgi:hypothetical protein
VLLVIVLFKFCLKQGGKSIQEAEQVEIQKIKQTEFEKKMENELANNSYEDSCYQIIQNKLDKHKKDLDSVKKNNPNSFSDFILNLASDERDISGFIDSNFYKTDFDKYYFDNLKSKLLYRYINNFDSLVLNF